MMIRRIRFLTTWLFAAVSLVICSPAVAAKKDAPPPPPPRPAYARVADLVIASPAIAIVGIKGLTAIPSESAPGLAAGRQRFLVSVQTMSLIRSNDVLARDASFLIDLPAQPKGKPPKWKGRVYLIFGTVQERVDFFQLLSSSALIPWSADNEAFVRRVAKEISAPDAPPVIKGIDSVFHVAGAVAGEGETQIFLLTGDGSPISLSIIRKTDEQPQFGVSLGEIVDDAAAPPKPETPLWYRLACFLPTNVPGRVLAGQPASDAAAATKDYADFLKALPPCDRAALPIE